jgi:hypothetical protein
VFVHLEITAKVLSKLEKARRETDLVRSFALLEEALLAEEFNLRRWARVAIQKVTASVGARKPKQDKSSIAETVSPVAITCLSATNPELRRTALRALEELAEALSHPSSFVFHVATRLNDEDPKVAAKAAKILYYMSKGGVRIDAALSGLERAHGHPEMSVRIHAARAISQHLQNVGVEKPLKLHRYVPTESPDRRVTSYEITVSHRRTWALDDELCEISRYHPSGFPGEISPFSHHVCGVCRSKNIRLIYGHDASGNDGRIYKHEYLCEDCGKYTVYEFLD